MVNSISLSSVVRGKFISRNIKLEPHEIETINFFLDRGENVEQIPPSNTPHNKRADVFMRGLIWEMKSPTCNSIKALEKLFYRASQQSPNIIFDLRRLKLKNEKMIVDKLRATFVHTRKSRNLLIITNSQQLLEFHKNR